MIKYKEEEIKGIIEELEDNAFGMYAAQILFNAEAYAALKMMPEEIGAGIKSGRFKEITLTQAERLSRNEEFLQHMREGRHNIKAYWDEKQRMVVFGIF